MALQTPAMISHCLSRYYNDDPDDTGTPNHFLIQVGSPRVQMAAIIGDQIRLLDLLPTDGDVDNAPIRCNLRVVRLSDEPQYEAVSYVWGDSAGVKKPIEIAGTVMEVTSNLEVALRYLRLPSAARTLWIDQLCIAQDDLNEKASQVRLMRHIYCNASSCAAWLGDIPPSIPQSDATAALELIEYMSKCTNATNVEEIVPPPFMASLDKFAGPVAALKTIAVPHNPWWERIWTLQEAVLPPKLFMIWGELSIPWGTLTMAARTWTSLMPSALSRLLTRANHETIGDLMCHVIWINNTKNGLIGSQNGTGSHPVELIVKWRGRLAADPRDKVYALLGLRRDGELPSVRECDYSGT